MDKPQDARLNINLKHARGEVNIDLKIPPAGAPATQWTLPARPLDARLQAQWAPSPKHPQAYVSKTDANTFLVDTQDTRHYSVLQTGMLMLVCSVGDHWHFYTQQNLFWFQQRMKSPTAAGELWGRIGQATSKLEQLVLDIAYIKSDLVTRGKELAEQIAAQVAPCYEAWRAAQPNADQLPRTVEARIVAVDRTTAQAAVREVVRLTHPAVKVETRAEFLRLPAERRPFADCALHGELRHPAAGKSAPAA